MAAKKKSEYAWMRYFALKVFIKRMQDDALNHLYEKAKKGKGQDLIFDMARQHAEKTGKTCPAYERFRLDYREEKGLEGVFIRFPNNRPQAGDIHLAIIRIQGQQEPVFLKFGLLQFFGPLIQLKEELSGPQKDVKNPFRLKAVEAEWLLEEYMEENEEMLLNA